MQIGKVIVRFLENQSSKSFLKDKEDSLPKILLHF